MGWTPPPEIIMKMGQVPDAELAATAGVTLAMIRNHRHRRGIPGHTRTTAFQWTAARKRLLGTQSDLHLAKRWGISPGRIRRQRMALEIAAADGCRRIDWTQVDPLLATHGSYEIEELTGVPEPSIRRRRRTLGIPSPKDPRQPPRRWLRRDLRLLGKVPDQQIAQRLGCTGSTVAAKRQELGIPRYQPPHHGWDNRAISLLGTAPDARIAQILGKRLAAVTKERLRRKIPNWTPPVEAIDWSDKDAHLGTAPDRLLAAEWGVSTAAVNCRRNFLGIEAWGPEPANKHNWTDDQLALLGTAPDRVVAAQIRLSAPTIGKKRRSLGIASFRDNQRWGMG